MYGKVQETPQNEKTGFYPLSPYGVAKLYAHWITKNYREAYNIFGSNGILFNHESPRRGETFVTKKIIQGLVKIKKGYQEKLFLGNLYSKRDWGHAKDYVFAMWKMLQIKKPQDFVIGTGKTHTVRYFIDLAFKRVNLNYKKFIIIDSDNGNKLWSYDLPFIGSSPPITYQIDNEQYILINATGSYSLKKGYPDLVEYGNLIMVFKLKK